MTELELVIENVGGIDETELTISDGPTLITGANASNKTSLLQALLFALSKDDISIRTGTDRARVKLTIDGDIVEREATRDSTGVSIEGDPLITDPDDRDLFERFAALLETNPLRMAVQTTSNFESLLKEPMDIDTLEAKRSQKLQEKQTLKADLEDMEGLDDKIDTAESDLRAHREELDNLEAELNTLYEELPDQNDGLESLRQRRTELVSERNKLETQISDIESAVERLDGTIDDLKAELAEIDGTDEMESLRKRRAELREEVEAIDQRINVLQSALTANREILDADMRDVFDYEPGLNETTMECWACGQQASMSSFEAVVDRLRDLIEQERNHRQQYGPELEDIESRIEDVKAERRHQSNLEEQIRSTESKLESRVESLDQKREQLADIEAELSTVDDQLTEEKEARTEDHSEISQQIEQKRVDFETKRQEIERLENRQSELIERRTEQERKQEQLAVVNDEIEELMCRIENLESELRETFNNAMDELLDAFQFEDVERMWLDGEFDLVIAREVDGTIREDTIENLAESERSMIGLVLGLAGYLAYDVDTIGPVLVLDSLGVFDADRANELIEYFGRHSDFLVAAVHPEQVEETTERQTTLAMGH